jgi:type I restriction enzyme M protein
MHSKAGLTSSEEEILQTKTFYGKELKGLAYIIAMMNMILHGVQSPNIVRTNTLSENLANIQPSDQKDVVLANPPFGGSEREEVQQNFPIKSSETAYMFLQHFIKMMKAGGRAGIVIKNTFLSNGDATALRRKLLDECNLHTVLDLPSGVFTGAGVKTVVLFFTKGEPTQKIWYYQVDKHFTKTQPMTEADLADFLAKQKTREDSEYSWTIDASELDDDLDLSVKNPHKVEEVDERTPQEVFDNIMSLGSEADEILGTIQEEFWKDDIDDVFGFVDEDSDDYIIHHCLSEEESAEYHALLEQVDELQEKFFEANPEDQNRLRLEIRELYGKAEDLVNQYKKDDDSSEEDEA